MLALQSTSVRAKEALQSFGKRTEASVSSQQEQQVLEEPGAIMQVKNQVQDEIPQEEDKSTEEGQEDDSSAESERDTSEDSPNDDDDDRVVMPGEVDNDACSQFGPDTRYCHKCAF